MTDILPGTIGLTPISGRVGKLIEFGQFLNGEGFQEWEHAFVLLPGNNILEAEPGGARIVPLVYTNVYWCENIWRLVAHVDPAVITTVAEHMKGIPYSALDYFALAAHRLHIPVPGLKQYIVESAHEICSQLADDFYQRLRAQIFDDGRWAGFVTPASLYRRDLELQSAG